MSATRLIIERSDFHELPRFCASCLSLADLEYKVVHSPNTFWSEGFDVSVPLCPQCSRKKNRKPLSIALIIAMGFLIMYAHQNQQVSALWGLVVVLLPIVERLLGERLKGPVRVQAKSNGKLIFWFSNPEYTRLVEAENQCSYDSAVKAAML